MVLTILFILILLIGVSLFIAAVGTALLRRNSRYVGRSSPYMAGRAMYREQPRHVYEERITERGAREERREQVEREAPYPGYTPIEPRAFEPRAYEPRPFEPRGYPAPPPRYPSAEGKWFALGIVILVVMFFAVFFGVRAYQSATSKPRISFCEYVDFVNMKPVNASDTFTRGNVTLFLRSRAPLEMDKVRIEVYGIDREGIVPFTSKEMPMKPEWTSFSVKILFDKIGTYTVMLYNNAGALIGQKTISIVPDSYAYKPVRG